jgi:hypothetical protein
MKIPAMPKPMLMAKAPASIKLLCIVPTLRVGTQPRTLRVHQATGRGNASALKHIFIRISSIIPESVSMTGRHSACPVTDPRTFEAVTFASE